MTDVSQELSNDPEIEALTKELGVDSAGPNAAASLQMLDNIRNLLGGWGYPDPIEALKYNETLRAAALEYLGIAGQDELGFDPYEKFGDAVSTQLRGTIQDLWAKYEAAPSEADPSYGVYIIELREMADLYAKQFGLQVQDLDQSAIGRLAHLLDDLGVDGYTDLRNLREEYAGLDAAVRDFVLLGKDMSPGQQKLLDIVRNEIKDALEFFPAASKGIPEVSVAGDDKYPDLPGSHHVWDRLSSIIGAAVSKIEIGDVDIGARTPSFMTSIFAMETDPVNAVLREDPGQKNVKAEADLPAIETKADFTSAKFS